MTLLSPGIAQGCFELLDTASRHALLISSIATSFPKFGSVDSRVVLETTQSMNWLCANEDGAALITPTGSRLIAIGSYRGQLRQGLLDYIEIIGPPWAELAVYGRRKVLSYAPATIQQMLVEAGLADGSEMDVVAFWDAMAARARGLRNDSLTAIGREGERLTISFEEKRTGRKPKWVAIDSNEKGYDVLSVLSSENLSPCSIEVKATTQGTNGRFHVTRNEWDRACEAESHLFHLWDLSSKTEPMLAIVKLEQLETHIPSDAGLGTWERVEIPLKAFDMAFSSVI